MESKNDKGQVQRNFCSHLIMTPDHPQLAAVKQLIKDTAKDAWGDDAETFLTQLVAQDRICLHRGDISKPGQDGYAGNFYISANSKVRPLILDSNREPLTESDGRPYSGCYANAIIGLWPQQSQYGKRINAQIQGVQFLRDGEAFGGGRVAQIDEFGEVETEGADAEAPDASAAGVDDLLG